MVVRGCAVWVWWYSWTANVALLDEQNQMLTTSFIASLCRLQTQQRCSRCSARL
jgi:hypothetical protein